jgi:hypothetical protein
VTSKIRSSGVKPLLNWVRRQSCEPKHMNRSHLSSAWLVHVLATVAALIIAASIIVISLAFIPLVPVRRAESPDGGFEAVARTAPMALLLPVMPGQSGDHPGRITIYTKDGRSCGSAPVDMVWMIQDLRWYPAGKPREASLVAGAKWDLDACSVAVYDR